MHHTPLLPHPSAGIHAALLLALSLAVAAPGAARAAPRLLVKGEASVRLLSLAPRGNGALLRGELRDASLKHGLAGRRVRLSVERAGEVETHTAITDRNGRFSLWLPHRLGSFTVTALFAGDRHYRRVAAPPRLLDISKGTVALQLTLPEQLDAAVGRQRLPVEASSGGQPISLPLTLATRQGRVLSRLTTDRRGRGTFSFETWALGQPGPLTLEVRFAGDGRHNALVQRAETVLATPVTLSLAAEELEVPADGEVSLSGRLQDLLGPVAGGTVSVSAQGRHLESLRSDEDGAFALRIDAEELPTGQLELEASFSPAVVWRGAARAAVELTLLPPRPIPWTLYLVPALVTALLLAALALVRFWPLVEGLLRGLPRRRRHEEGEEEEEPEPIRSGVRLARPSIRALIHQSQTISGEVWDATDGVLIPGATVLVRGVDGEARCTVRTNGAGAFATPELAEGRYRLTVRCRAYVSETFEAQLPHRGAYDGLQINLLQVRVKLLEIYRGVARPLLPQGALWACWTPRDLLRHLSRQRGRRPRPMEQLTTLLEQSYWAPAPPEETQVERAEALARDVR